MSFLAEGRMEESYPFALWAASWLCIVKAVLWAAVDTDVVNHMVLIKYLAFAVFWAAFAYRISRADRLAFYGIVLLSVLDIVFTFMVPESFVVVEAMKKGKAGAELTFLAMFCTTYLSSALLLGISPWLNVLTRGTGSAVSPEN